MAQTPPERGSHRASYFTVEDARTMAKDWEWRKKGISTSCCLRSTLGLSVIACPPTFFI